MTKVIRKYNKIILAVFGVFLLITWLFTGSSGIFQPNPEKQVAFRLGSEKVRAGEFQHSNAEFEGLKGLIPELLGRLGVSDPTHWFLLTREAQSQGLVGNAADGEAWIPELATTLVPIRVEFGVLEQYRQSSPQTYRMLLQNRQLLSMLAQQQLRDPKQVEDAAKSIEADLRARIPYAAGGARLTEDEVRLALAKFHGIVRMFNSYSHAGRMSDKRLIEAARTRFDRVRASVVSVPASAMVDPAATPPEAELAAHFDAYAGVQPGDGEFGFGYMQPERVKLEWIKVDIGAVRDAIQVDPVAANIHWQQNRAKYPNDFATERDNVIAELKGRRVQEVMGEADRAYKARVRVDTRRLESDGSVKRLPADWQTPSMDALAQAIVEGVKASKVTIPTPLVEKRTQWVRVPEAGTLPGIGQASLMLSTRELSLADLLMNTKELSPKLDTGLQARVAYESALTDDLGNRFYILVTDARAAGRAESLDEVRADVVKDVLSLSAFKALEARLPELQAQAAVDGLDAVGKTLADASMDKSRSLNPFHDQIFTQARSPEIVNDDPEGTFRTALFDQARVLGVLTPATPDNMALRTVAVAIPKSRTLVIAQVTGVDPVTVEALRNIRPAMSDNFIVDELMEGDGGMPYTLDALKTRLGYKDTRPQDPATTPETAPPANKG
jgi:hypothetical protein